MSQEYVSRETYCVILGMHIWNNNSFKNLYSNIRLQSWSFVTSINQL